jgi:hypothetical protein
MSWHPSVNTYLQPGATVQIETLPKDDPGYGHRRSRHGRAESDRWKPGEALWSGY